MMISVRIKLFLNIFNNKVIIQCFHYFLFEKKVLLKNFFNYKIIGFIIIWLNITLIKQRRLRWVYQKQKFQYGSFIFISQLLNGMKYVFTGTLKKLIISFSLLRPLDGVLIVFRPF